MDLWSEWTREGVEERLVAAFRALPHTALYGRGARLRLADGRACPMTQVLGWLELIADDPEARAYLAAWARCKAMGERFSEHIVARGWKRSTAEDGRRRGAAAIAAALALVGGLPATPPPGAGAGRAATRDPATRPGDFVARPKRC